MTLLKRSTVNPVMVICGCLTALSGFFLMFHYESHFTKAIHQIGGILLIIFVAMHIFMNWKTLAGSLNERFVTWAAVVFAVCAVTMAVTSVHTHRGLKRLMLGIEANQGLTASHDQKNKHIIRLKISEAKFRH